MIYLVYKCRKWGAKMFLSGYHGTTLSNANKILKDGKFKLSRSNTEWLGKGIYFYFDINDAYYWRENEAIMHSVVKIDPSEYLDIDTQVGMEIFNDILEFISKTQRESFKNSNNIQQNQCAVMKALWNSYPKLKVISASFPKERTKIKTLLDKRPRRKEFCVRNNNYIKYTQLIKKGDLDD